MAEDDETKQRRTGRERRGDTTNPQRKRDRRMEDRRESPRVPIKVLVRQVELGGSFEEREGDIALGGMYFQDKHLPVGTKVELRFKVPGVGADVRVEGEILRISGKVGAYGAHVKFGEMPTRTELAIARLIDDHELDDKKK